MLKALFVVLSIICIAVTCFMEVVCIVFFKMGYISLLIKIFRIVTNEDIEDPFEEVDRMLNEANEIRQYRISCKDEKRRQKYNRAKVRRANWEIFKRFFGLNYSEIE